MPFPVVNLDDRKFDDLFHEARRRIPVYAPEWTDHNESDPGITLLQLFAWLEEMIVWRLNRVPLKNYMKFLELVGMQLKAAAPAKAELTFQLTKGAKQTTIPKGTQVSMAGGGDGPPIIFETDDNLVAAGVKLVSIQSFDGADYTVLPLEDPAGVKAIYALSGSPQQDSTLYLGTDEPFPAGQQRLTIHVESTLGGGAILAGDQRALEVTPPVRAFWEYWAGEGKGWRRLKVERDDTYALLQSGAVIFTAPIQADGKTSDAQKRKLGLLKKQSDPELYWLRFRIAEVLGAGYERAPKISSILLNTMTATNAVTEREELLGAANGLPNQTFQLVRFPVLPLEPEVKGRIAVDEGDEAGFVTWEEVSDFSGSTREDRHYTLNLATGLVSFGDGAKGRMPRWLSSNGSNKTEADVANVKAVSYRWGGGKRANGAAGTITGLQSAVAFVESVTNLAPAVGGEDEETIEGAQLRAPMQLRTAQRAVTAEDFAYLATQTPGAQIRRAQAFPLLNPSFRMKRTAADGVSVAEVPVPGAMTVVVVPEGESNPKPEPNEGTLKLVASWLDRHRLLTTELFVAAPHYRQIYIEGRVIAKPTADAAQVEAALKQRLLTYFHPLVGGAEGTGWDFGHKVFFSETYRQVLETEGVLRIESGSLKTFLDDVEQPPCEDIELEPDELLFSTEHDVRVSYE